MWARYYSKINKTSILMIFFCNVEASIYNVWLYALKPFHLTSQHIVWTLHFTYGGSLGLWMMCNTIQQNKSNNRVAQITVHHSKGASSIADGVQQIGMYKWNTWKTKILSVLTVHTSQCGAESCCYESMKLCHQCPHLQTSKCSHLVNPSE